MPFGPNLNNYPISPQGEDFLRACRKISSNLCPIANLPRRLSFPPTVEAKVEPIECLDGEEISIWKRREKPRTVSSPVFHRGKQIGQD